MSEFSIIYTTGNGYRCSCCRWSHTSYLDYDNEYFDVQDAINSCIILARDNDWDFYIDSIKGFNGDVDELEKQITSAVDKAEKDDIKREKIEKIKNNINEHDWWFNNLESEKIERASKRKELQAQLRELEEQI